MSAVVTLSLSLLHFARPRWCFDYRYCSYYIHHASALFFFSGVGSAALPLYLVLHPPNTSGCFKASEAFVARMIFCGFFFVLHPSLARGAGRASEQEGGNNTKKKSSKDAREFEKTRS